MSEQLTPRQRLLRELHEEREKTEEVLEKRRRRLIIEQYCKITKPVY
tara:strand:- start:490 stop:630 length:141 start_codon:yes stop_codon:yes gene_type:complete